MVSPRLRTRMPLPDMQWNNSWTVAKDGGDHHEPRGVRLETSVPRTLQDSVSPSSKSVSPSLVYTGAKFDAGAAVSSWIETAALDSGFSLDNDFRSHDDFTLDEDVEMVNEVGGAGAVDEDEALAETRRRNSLGLALDLRDLKSLMMTCSLSDKAPLSRPYPSPVSPATTLFLRSNISPATSSAASEADSYFDCFRTRQLSNATSAYTSNYGGDDEDEDRCKVERNALPPSPELIPLSLPSVPSSSFSQLPELPPVPASTTAPSHPLHRAHRLSMTPFGAAPPQLTELPTIDETSTQPPRVRKNSIVDLPPVSLSGAAETGLQPLPPTPPRSPRAHLRITPLPAFEVPKQYITPAAVATTNTRAWTPSESIPQSFKRQRRE
ncbi:hypothetical protein JCM10908_001903 [Rhodotorula pacifica]|uniref:uncharacterized protein n=1 Tax=Rhodotorula pacifica TaxID=1495444 RepID=UPI00318228D3